MKFIPQKRKELKNQKAFFFETVFSRFKGEPNFSTSYLLAFL
jgi:hypothetical protein